MGITGAGKSTFIKQVSGLDVQVGHSLRSCTSEIGIYAYPHSSGRTIYLVDTPGFDDTERSDKEILENIADFFARIYSGKYPVAGLIYLHKIDGNRMQGSSRRNLKLLQDICGTKTLDSVILATTMWDKVDPDDGERNERELISNKDFWGRMIDAGSAVRRHDRKAHSAASIVSDIVDKAGRRFEKPVLQIQTEMVDDGKLLNQTAAGISLVGDLELQAEKHKSELASLQKEWKEAMEAKDKKWQEEVEEESRAAREKLRQAEQDKADLAVSLANIQKKKKNSFWRVVKKVAKIAVPVAIGFTTGIFVP